MAAQPPDREIVTALVADATAAPSMHNAQPWRFRYHAASQTFELRADLDRAMPKTDPDHRALHLGCGAALLNLRVAAARSGWAAETRLLPDPADELLLATVRLTEPADERLAALHPAVRRRHTSRYPFADQEVPQALRDELVSAAQAEGAELAFPGAWHAETLLSLIEDAEGRDTLDGGPGEDVLRWTRTGHDTGAEGIPEYAFGPRKASGKAPARDFAGRRPVADRGSTTFENVPHLALLGTAEDRLADWLRAGQAMERVLLLATTHDLATSLTSHALESADLRPLLRDPDSAMGFVQMVLRIGYGPLGPVTPRRPVAEVLEFV